MNEPTEQAHREVSSSEVNPSGARIFLMGASPGLGHNLTDSGNDYKLIPTSAERLNRTGGNTGNQVIAYGLLREIRFSSVSWDHSIGPQRVNSEYDFILIAAANFLHTGFDLGDMASFIEATQLPCAMVGVGAQSNDYSPDIPLKPGTERLMRVVAERSKLIGARGPFTAEVLKRLGIQNVQITGCPSYYMNCCPTMEIRKPALSGNSKFIVNSSRDVIDHSFDRERMIKVVCGLMRFAISENADFVAQSELPEIEIADSTDPTIISDCVEKMLIDFPYFRGHATDTEMFSWFRGHVKVFWDVKAWYSAMRGYDFVFGNRFHGNLIALLAGTPACIICHDSRTTEMCEFFHLPHVVLHEINQIDPYALYDLVDCDAISARYAELYPKFISFLSQNGLDPTGMTGDIG